MLSLICLVNCITEFPRELICSHCSLNITLQCPGCKSFVIRQTDSNLRVLCTVCSIEKKKPYQFCWQCLGECKGLFPRLDRCENYGCVNRDLEILKTCTEITFESVKGVTGCPSVQACPTCGLVVVHDTTKCKNLTCIQCKVGFCFVCLKLTKECLDLKNGSYHRSCFSGVAPRQTSLPVWNRK